MVRHANLPERITHFAREERTNRIVYSRYQKLEASTVSDAYSLKYVSRGEECYFLAGRREPVRERQFLLVNEAQEVAVEIDARETVEGMCIFLSKPLVDEVYRTWQYDSESLLEGSGTATSFPGLFASRYLAEQSALGQYLDRLSSHYQGKQRDDYFGDKSHLYTLTELLCQHQAAVGRRMDRLQSRKRSTREELLRRLTMGLEYMHDNWQIPPKMPAVARAAALSEYHFYRLFRQAYQQSPQQYLLAYRLDRSRELLKVPHHSVTEVAEACGFYDVHHYNKAFRRRFGKRPSDCRGKQAP